MDQIGVRFKGERLKHLTITYTTEQGEQTLFDSDIQELVWSDTPNGVKVEGRVKAVAKSGAGGGLLDMITNMSKASTANKANQLREAAETEAVEAAVEEEPVEVS